MVGSIVLIKFKIAVNFALLPLMKGNDTYVDDGRISSTYNPTNRGYLKKLQDLLDVFGLFKSLELTNSILLRLFDIMTLEKKIVHLKIKPLSKNGGNNS